MAILYYLLETDHDPGAGAETINRDLPRQGVTKALIFDLTAQEVSSSVAGTRLNMGAQLDQIRIGAVESNRVSEIDGEDLDAWNGLNGNSPLFDAQTGADNARIQLGMTYNLDPYMLGPRMDYNQGFGIGGNVARKVEIAYAGDDTDIDSKNLAIGLINNTSQGSSGGYVTFHRNAPATGANTVEFSDVVQPGRLLGVLNFETTGAADITADGSGRAGQDIREQSITVNRKIQLGPIYSTTMGAISGTYEVGVLTDEGYSFWDLGMWNSGRIGLPQASDIPSNMEVRTLRGTATTASRVYPVTLNTNT